MRLLLANLAKFQALTHSRNKLPLPVLLHPSSGPQPREIHTPTKHPIAGIANSRLVQEALSTSSVSSRTLSQGQGPNSLARRLSTSTDATSGPHTRISTGAVTRCALSDYTQSCLSVRFARHTRTRQTSLRKTQLLSAWLDRSKVAFARREVRKMVDGDTTSPTWKFTQ